jgi:hypothetical protein
MMEGVWGVGRYEKTSNETGFQFPTTRKGGLDRLIRVYGYLVAAVYKWRKKEGAQAPVSINPIKKRGHKIRYPSSECR